MIHLSEKLLEFVLQAKRTVSINCLLPGENFVSLLFESFKISFIVQTGQHILVTLHTLIRCTSMLLTKDRQQVLQSADYLFGITTL